MELVPAGGVSRLMVETYDVNGVRKLHGGDYGGENGRSFVCVRMCVVNVCLWENDLLQTSHVYGRSPL